MTYVHGTFVEHPAVVDGMLVATLHDKIVWAGPVHMAPLTGAKCICQHDDWYNAFGDSFAALHMGDRLTVRASKRVGGARFLAFNETPEDHFFLESGFVPMRALN